MKLIIIRHAETVKNKEGLTQGHGDSLFTSKGRIQLQKTKKYLQNFSIKKVYSSDLGRSVNSAKELFTNKEIVTTPLLREINWGDWSNLKFEELLKKWNVYYQKSFDEGIPKEEIRPPDGENTYDHLKRIKKFLSKLEFESEDNIAIVGHGGTNKVLIGFLNKSPPQNYYNLKQENCCINILDLDYSGNIVKSDVNIIEHLK